MSPSADSHTGMSAPTTVRPFRWADLDALAPVYNAVTGAAGSDAAVDAELLRQMLSLPGRDAERDCHVADRDGALVGFALVTAETRIRRAVIGGGVMEAHRGLGIGRTLLRAAVVRAEEAGAAIAHVQAPETADAARRLLESEGFVQTRRYLDLAWEGERVPMLELDSGYAVRCLESGDERALTDLQNACFEGSWGFCPNTVEETAARLAFGISFPCGVVFVEHDGRPAAYAWTFMSGDTGWIGMTGVHPDYRGLGLAKTALTAGMTCLAENGAKTVRLEVDDANAAAKRVYSAAGFREVGSTVWYERSAAGGSGG